MFFLWVEHKVYIVNLWWWRHNAIVWRSEDERESRSFWVPDVKAQRRQERKKGKSLFLPVYRENTNKNPVITIQIRYGCYVWMTPNDPGRSDDRLVSVKPWKMCHCPVKIRPIPTRIKKVLKRHKEWAHALAINTLAWCFLVCTTKTALYVHPPACTMSAKIALKLRIQENLVGVPF